jgi:pyridoxine 5-phosphate synthase
MPTALSVNLNKIALLRNSREGNYPNVLQFAQLAIESGANGITVHPRPDQRHIRPDDVYQLSAFITQYLKQQKSDTRNILTNSSVLKNHAIEFTIEGNPFEVAQSSYPGFMALVEKTRPHQATLVPDSNDQLTSDHGFDLRRDGEKLRPIIQQLKQWGVRISLFMDPDLTQIELAKTLGADRIELYTGPYAASFKDHTSAQLETYQKAANYAHDIGLGVNAGHDLNLHNLATFLVIGNIAEVSIGHALTVDALLMGYKNTINAYSKICQLD